MRKLRTLALGAMMLVLVGACASGGGKPAIKIGSDGFYESKLMAEIYAQALEANGYTVQRNLGLGSRAVSAPALESGQIDLKPEYIGSGLAYYDKTRATGDPAANEAALQAILATRGGGITVLNYSPAQDQNAFVVRKDTATQFKLTKMSDTTAVQNQLKWGLATDCPTNPVCAAALKSAYGLAPTNVTLLAACSTPMAQALANRTIDVGELCSTQPDIAVNGFVVLQDDRQTQPADNIAPLVRNDYLAKLSASDRTAFESLLNSVSARMDTATLTSLGKEVSVDNKDVAAVATEWLKANGFVK
ncbi:MAG TPA: ABC transporter substrate-binding protein [Candidatus Saccharimonadales bacterium]|nr:ABC transporter substrate-binding protein [Candidatus Saccharimonadales bacterium]